MENFTYSYISQAHNVSVVAEAMHASMAGYSPFSIREWLLWGTSFLAHSLPQPPYGSFDIAPDSITSRSSHVLDNVIHLLSEC